MTPLFKRPVMRHAGKLFYFAALVAAGCGTLMPSAKEFPSAKFDRAKDLYCNPKTRDTLKITRHQGKYGHRDTIRIASGNSLVVLLPAAAEEAAKSCGVNPGF